MCHQVIILGPYVCLQLADPFYETRGSKDVAHLEFKTRVFSEKHPICWPKTKTAKKNSSHHKLFREMFAGCSANSKFLYFVMCKLGKIKIKPK